jgi:hypothetical protein
MSREPYPEIGELMFKHGKPVALCLLSQCDYTNDVQSRMEYPIFETPEETIETLAMLRDYYARKR